MNKRIFIGITAAWILIGVTIIITVNSHTVNIFHKTGLAAQDAKALRTGTNGIQSDMQSLLQAVRPCVVSVESYVNTIASPVAQGTAQALDPFQQGSKIINAGIIIDRAGHVLTTKSAVPSNQIEVKLYKRSDNVYKAGIVKVDNDLGLALLQVNGLSKNSYCRVGDSSTTQVGDIVFAIGSPYGFSGTVTSGIVSGNRKNVNVEGRVFTRLIQTDAVVNEGNAGGPLINIKGEVIGVNAAIYSKDAAASGVGFAIPINEARGLIKSGG